MVNQISPVNVSPLQLKNVLDDPHSVVGAVLVSNQNCTIDTYIIEFNISLDSMGKTCYFNGVLIQTLQCQLQYLM